MGRSSVRTGFYLKSTLKVFRNGMIDRYAFFKSKPLQRICFGKFLFCLPFIHSVLLTLLINSKLILQWQKCQNLVAAITKQCWSSMFLPITFCLNTVCDVGAFPYFVCGLRNSAVSRYQALFHQQVVKKTTHSSCASLDSAVGKRLAVTCLDMYAVGLLLVA